MCVTSATADRMLNGRAGVCKLATAPTFFMRVATADLRALLYIRSFSLSLMRCVEFCFATTVNAALATLHCRRGAAQQAQAGQHSITQGICTVAWTPSRRHPWQPCGGYPGSEVVAQV